MLAEFGVDIDPAARMGSLPVGLRQIVEIVKATSTGARVLLLDEPTSAIAEREVARLIASMRMLRDRGVAILFTTHKMEEIRAIADRVVVLRDGGLVADAPLSELTDDDIVTAMIGRELEDLFPDLPCGGRRRRAVRARAHLLMRLPNPSTCRCVAARSWVSPGSSAPDAPS